MLNQPDDLSESNDIGLLGSKRLVGGCV